MGNRDTVAMAADRPFDVRPGAGRMADGRLGVGGCAPAEFGGDIPASAVERAPPRVGGVIVMAAAGAHCRSLQNNDNGARRPPVDARVVARRKTYEDLPARNVG